MLKALLAAGVILLMLLGWTWVQHIARKYAERHPEFGPAREEGSGCGSGCHCAGGQCTRKDKY
jgi:hypothetical protein